MAHSISRRDFLILSARGAGAAVVSYGLMGCDILDDENPDIAISFAHGIASGDPLSDSIILWTRITPESDADISVSWEIASDDSFTELINTGSTTTNADIEQGNSNVNLKWDLSNLVPLEIRELKMSFADMMDHIEQKRNFKTRLF